MSKQEVHQKPKLIGRYIVMSLLSIPGIVLFQFSFIFLFCGMLPSMVANLIDTTKARHITRTVTAMNLAGVFPIMILGGPLVVVKSRFLDPMTWLTIYGAAALGWMLLWICPRVVYTVMQLVYNKQILLLENQQKALIEKWGEEVSGVRKIASHSIP